MSTEAIGAPAPEATIIMDVDDQPAASTANPKPTGLHSPPDSNDAMNLDGSDSELSDLDEVAGKLDSEHLLDDVAPPPAVEAESEAKVVEEEKEEVEDIGDVLPDHWSGTVPVFRPTMKQFRDFKLFMEKIDKYGMKSGIVKIIPPEEWKNSLPPLDDLVKQVRVREPIKQDIMGSNGTYRQVNFLHQRSYNLPQWRQLCEQSEHQPPARRGERRANAEKHKPVTRTTRAAASSGASKSTSAPTKRRRGRPTRASLKAAKEEAAKEEAAETEERPMTPVSPPPEKEEVVPSVELDDPGVKEEECVDEDDAPVVRRMGFARQSKPKTQSTSARRKYSRREGSARIDEEAFKDWDYRMDVSDFTPERCEELERIYWKTLTYASPLYGADLLGTLFDEKVETWNLNKLPNLLDVLGTKVPGVNTAYLYLGMWKATFAWHLEDVDLYSINYLHFGAPKQWYSISQADARRFEAAMKNIWPTEAKACDQFLRHKSFLISPAHLKQHYNITVNKCVSYPGEFVVTYPYGYHSGYNLGYNCAEAVNFALDSWLPMGKIAKKCECAQAQDSVWVDVYEIERKMRGEETEYEETEDEEDEEEDDDDNDTGLPSPPSSHTVRVKAPGRKRKRGANDTGEKRVKKIRLRVKEHVETPCCLCPNDIPGAEIMPTDDGRKAHRMCALYLPETYIETVDDKEVIANVGGIDKARLDLKCLYCRSKKGACFQCSQKKCPRSYHATCAAAAGVFVEDGEVPVIGEDGTEYKEQAFEFSCRFHRTKRDRKLEGDSLEDDARTREVAAALKKNDICQVQFYRGDIFAGVVLENRSDEEMLLLHVIPNGDQVEVEWKWLLLPDPADLRLPKASPNAIPMPTSRKAQKELNAKRPVEVVPRKDDEFGPGFVWAEFHAGDPTKNSEQVKLDLSKDDQIWHYLGQTSTESKAQYTGDLARREHNVKSNFLDSIPKPPKPPKPTLMAAPPPPRRSYSATHPSQGLLMTVSPVPLPRMVAMQDQKPYAYKPRKSVGQEYGVSYTSQQFAPKPSPVLPRLQPLQPHQFPQRPPLPLPPPPMHQHVVLQPRPGPQTPHGGQQRSQSQQFHYQQPIAQVKPLQPLAMDPRPKKVSSTSQSSDRFAPVGGHHFQPHSRDWSSSSDAAANNGPPPIPMTSSSIRSTTSGYPQTGAAGAQPLASAHQKYTFFQFHHNRDSSRYRTPYGQWGGFCNGYEGNLRAFLVKAQRALAGDKDKGKAPIKAIPHSLLQPLPSKPGPLSLPMDSPGPRYGSPYSSRLLPRPDSQQPQSPRSPFAFEISREFSPTFHGSPYFNAAPSPSNNGSTSFEIKPPGSIPLHPAIRPQFQGSRPPSPASQRGDNFRSLSPQTPTSAVSQVGSLSQQPTQPKAQPFTKQSHSPIPLPPYVKQAALSSSTSGQKPSPLGQPPLAQQAPPQHNDAPSNTNNLPPARPSPALEPVEAATLTQNSDFQQASEPAGGTFYHHNPPPQPQHQHDQYQKEQQQQLQWASPYGPQGQPAYDLQQPSAASSATSMQQQEEEQPYYQAQEQYYHVAQDGGQLYPAAQDNGVSQMYYAPQATPGYGEIPPDQMGIVERMMFNLKRATQQGSSR